MTITRTHEGFILTEGNHSITANLTDFDNEGAPIAGLFQDDEKIPYVYIGVPAGADLWQRVFYIASQELRYTVKEEN